MITIKDIYAGKPDAKDEIRFDGKEDFLQTYIVPPNYDVRSLLYGTNCFVSGYKGIGKTALLFYLDAMLRKDNASSFSSFIFFKEDFPEDRRKKFERSARRFLASISIQKDVLVHHEEFEYIWRWLILKKY